MTKAPTGGADDVTANGVDEAGENFGFEIVVIGDPGNNKDANNVVVTDLFAGTLNCPGASTPPGTFLVIPFGTEESCTFLWPITPADVTLGRIVNTAQASWTNAGAGVSPITAGATGILRVAPLTMVVTSVYPPNPVVGSDVVFTVTVTNNGPVITATTVAITSNPAITATPACVASDILPLGQKVCTFTRTLVAADVTGERQITQEFTAAGTTGTTIPNPTTVTTSTLVEFPNLRVTKTGVWQDDGTGNAKVGDLILYTITVRNTLAVDVNNIVLTDPDAALTSCILFVVNLYFPPLIYL